MKKIFSLCFLTVFLYFSSSVTAVEAVSVAVDPNRQQVLTGSGLVIDNPYWTNNGVGYVISKSTIRRTAQVVEPAITSYLTSGKFTTPIQTTAFDSRGRWLAGIYDDGSGIIRGFYHAETQSTNSCDSISGIKSIAYAESSDGGLTWTIPNYPNNQVITGMFPEGAGDFQVRAFNDYIYIYYYEHACGSNVLSSGAAVARAPISSKGKPGSWKKYYCSGSICNFDIQPGLGGKFTRLPYGGQSTVNMGNLSVSWNRYLDKYISAAHFGGNDFVFVMSDDLVKWEPILPVHTIPAFPETGTITAYDSIISSNGEMASTGRSFWLYYVGVNHNLKRNTLYRQFVTLTASGTQTPTPTPNPLIGDANNDSKVDVADFSIWKTNYGKSAPAWPTGKTQGNFSSDGIVNIFDFALWKEALIL